MTKRNTSRTLATITVFLLSVHLDAQGGPPWDGFRDRSQQLNTKAFDFGAQGGGNENYYDGDFADFDGDGRMDRALISRYGLLWNQGGGVLLPVSTQQVGRAPNTSTSLTGYLFGDEVGIGNDAAQWADIDGDDDLDNIQGGNGEAFTIQVNRRGRFSIKRKLTGSALDIVNIDLEGDGDVDFAVAHAFCSDSRCGHGCPEENCGSGTWQKELHIWVNDGSGNFTDETTARGLNVGRDLIVGLVAGDVDGDRDFDILLLSGCSDGTTVACSKPGMVRGVNLARNNGAGVFTLEPVPFAQPVRAIGPITSGFSQGMNLGDIDDDGDLDLVCALGRDVAPHPKVGHAIFVNDGLGEFIEESAARFEVDAATPFLSGENGKLVDADLDGDLDFIAFQRDKNTLQVFINDGTGHFRHDPAHSFVVPGQPTALGNDTDVTDIDGDGAYDIWLGNAGTIVRPLINSFVAPDGLPADLPRGLHLVAADEAITIAFRAPSFASNVRHYKIYRSLAPDIATRDQLLLKTIASSRHEDEGFAAPISRHTTTEYLGDPVVEMVDDEIRFTDRSALAGVTYYYNVVHVGTENTASRHTSELVAGRMPEPPGVDATPPLLEVRSPDSQWWSACPRIVIEYADGGSGIDVESLEVFFDKALGTGNSATGGLPASSDLSDSFYRKDGNSYVYALGDAQSLPSGLATLTVRVADKSGNASEKRVTFNVTSSTSPAPTARLTASTLEGEAPLAVTFSGEGSTDSDGLVLRTEWYFGDGGEAEGREAAHVFREPGTYTVTLLVRDNEGRVSTVTGSILVRSPGPVLFRRGDANCDGLVDLSDAVAALNWMFTGGPRPCCVEGADTNDDGGIDVSDAVFLLLWRFVGGSPPPLPGPDTCGPDPAPEGGLGCTDYAARDHC